MGTHLNVNYKIKLKNKDFECKLKQKLQENQQ